MDNTKNIKKITEKMQNEIDISEEFKQISECPHFYDPTQQSWERDISQIEKQNECLKEENKALKQKLKSFHYRPSDIKENGVIILNQKPTLKELSKKQVKSEKSLTTTEEQLLLKQCRVYQNIFENMEKQIKKLTKEKYQLQLKLQQMKISEEKTQKNTEYVMLKKRINFIMDKYSQLESKMNQSQIQWAIWKQQWNSQKKHYLCKIYQLEIMLKGGSLKIRDKKKI